MGLTSEETVRRALAGTPRDVQHLAINQAVAYSLPIEKNTIVRVVCTDGALMKVCPEYAYGGYFGSPVGEREEESEILRSNIWDDWRKIWASEADDAELVANGIFNTDKATTTSGFVTLDEVLTSATQSHIMKIDNDGGTSDILELPLNMFPGVGGGPGIRGSWRKIPKDQTGMVLRIRHIDTSATEELEWALRSERSVDAVDDRTEYWDDGGGTWGATITWNTVTGSATAATFTASFNTQIFDGRYSLMFRPSAASANSVRLYSLSVHQALIASQGVRLLETGSVDTDPYVFTMPERGVLGFISDSDTKVAYITILE